MYNREFKRMGEEKKERIEHHETSGPTKAYHLLPSHCRLFTDALPQDRFHLQSLADKFFDRVSTLRCLGFIHKPTFYQALDRGTLSEDFGEAVICIVAALGAR